MSAHNLIRSSTKPAVIVKRERETSSVNLNEHSADKVGSSAGLPFSSCRDTAVGRALFNLYNKGRVVYEPNVVVRSQRVKVDPHAQHREKITQKAKESVVVKKKYTNLKFKKIEQEDQGRFAVPQGGRRAAAHISKNEIEYRPQHQIFIEPREQTIAKLQHAHATSTKATIIGGGGNQSMENSSSGSSNGSSSSSSSSSSKEKKSKNQIMFENIMREISERESFLVEMKKLNNANFKAEDERQIRKEIADRVADLRIVNDLIEQESE